MGYDLAANRGQQQEANIETAIPARRSRVTPQFHDAAKYRWRNLVECLFMKLKD